MLVAIIIGVAPLEAADTIFVNNRVGDDTADGRSDTRTDPHTGPVASIQRALELADVGSVISIAKTENPYYGSVKMFGRQHSGMSNFPFTIEGNGAIIDGSIAVAPEGWRKVGPDLWKLAPRRKGFFQLMLDGAVVPELPVPATAKAMPEVPVGQWCVWRGSIYYHANPRDYVPLQSFRIAFEDVGLTLYSVRNVTVRNLTFQRFRIDGVSAPDLSKNITLENVTSIENGRAGVAASGASQMLLRNCNLSGNRKEALLLTGRGSAKVEESTLSEPPTMAK
jgi:hypothetical protein